jgi:methylmalonyl-CoA carboxyltransferase large subunit
MKNSRVEKSREAVSTDLASIKQQVASLAESLESLRVQLAEQAEVLADFVARVGGTADQARRAPMLATAAADVSPQVLVVIAAAVTAFLGKKVRIRSAKMLQSPYEIVNPWAQQGRVIVQASHFLSRR